MRAADRAALWLARAAGSDAEGSTTALFYG